MNYVRFITPWWRMRRQVDSGPFGPAYEALRDREVPEVLRVAIAEEIGYPITMISNGPGRKDIIYGFEVESPRDRWSGVCWFGNCSRLVNLTQLELEGHVLQPEQRRVGLPKE